MKQASIFLLFALFSMPVWGAPTMDFKALRERYRTMLVGIPRGEENLPEVKESVARLDAATEKRLASLTEPEGRTCLWQEFPGVMIHPDTGLPANSPDLSATMGTLKRLALAYRTPGSKYYQQPGFLNRLSADLKWFLENCYSVRLKMPSPFSITFNWFDVELGASMALGDTAMLLDDQLTPELKTLILAVMHHFVPETLWSVANKRGELTGANLMWKTKSYILAALLAEDLQKLDKAKQGLRGIPDRQKDDIFTWVTEGDGFYPDGSFVQHLRLPYNLGYGRDLFMEIINLTQILADSPWAFSKEDMLWLAKTFERAYEPFIFRGATCDAVVGREISRPIDDLDRGNPVVASALRLARILPDEEGRKVASQVKYWILANTTQDFRGKEKNRMILNLANDLVADSSIPSSPPPEYYRQFAAMDRAVLSRSNYRLTLAMSSSRIWKYESGNRENLKGWHSSDGMTYLYNVDLKQFADFWPTVDSMRLPGTTVDSTPREAKEVGFMRGFLSPYSWVGGCSFSNRYGASGMWLKAEKSTLEAKKSWFCFDDEIVCLGAGINAADSGVIETVVENRKLNRKDGSQKLTVDGTQPGREGAETLPKARWAHLEGVDNESDIGYVFPEQGPLHALVEERKGNWWDVNQKPGSPKKEVSGRYATMWFDHGTSPVNGVYAYALLPGWSSSRVEAYAKAPRFTILRNDSNAQAVHHNGLGLTMVNFWSAGECGGIRVDKPCSVVFRKTSNGFDLALSDPTQEAEAIEVTLHLPISSISQSANSFKITDAPSGKMHASITGAKGQSFQGILR